ncbi:MAG: hypothetical protein L0H50_11835, partial [Staphylococcus equorum]|nr:hypothetical protein [Staphylococcus equorum]
DSFLLKLYYKFNFATEPEMKYTFISAIIPVFTGFSMLGLFISISPNFLGEVLHVYHKAIIGTIVFLSFFASAIGQLFF